MLKLILVSSVALGMGISLKRKCLLQRKSEIRIPHRVELFDAASVLFIDVCISHKN